MRNDLLMLTAATVASKGSSPMATMNMKMKVDAKRVGDCKASQS